MLDAVLPVLLIEVHDAFRVALCAVDMAAREHLLAEVGVVIDFAVVHDPDGAVFIGKRLVTGFDINDAEATHGESGIIGDHGPGVVGTTMHDLLVHFEQRGFVGTLTGSEVKDAADTAHISRSSIPSVSRDWLSPPWG